MNKFVAVMAVVFAASPSAVALDRGENDVLVRVLDVGAGLACVIVLPGNQYIVYDTGHWNTDNFVLNQVQALIPPGSEIELLVQSHSDSDHLGATDEICTAYRVKRILHTGMERDTGTWRDADAAIRAEQEAQGASNINLATTEFLPGSTYRFGDTYVTMVFGTGGPLPEWSDDNLSEAERNNAVSIVIRIVYDNKSILLCGDSVGRHIDDEDAVCIVAEKAMVDSAHVIPINSDVIVAPHHGADNGSSTAFIQAVSPEFVVFSAGHAYGHPRQTAAERYLANGVNVNNIFRTDLGDNEGGNEWNHGNSPAQDRSGDDTVDILLKRDAPKAIVAYSED
jgi:competence protein ComEC